MNDILTTVFAQFNEQTITIFALIFFLLTITLIVYWLYNRRRFRELSHQIPASVVKSYLDSIIQNSTSLKSSLFRGGGLDIGEGIPTIVSTNDLPRGNVEIVDNSAELNAKNNEINGLRNQLTDRDNVIADLQSQLNNALSGNDNGEELTRLNGELSNSKAKISELEAALAEAKANAGSGGGSGVDEAALAAITAERDELKERLMEYEIIEEDLANLKRLQQENAELKKALEGGGAPAVAEQPVAQATPDPAPAEEPDEFEAAMAEMEATPEPEPAAEEPVAEAAPADDGGEPEEQKSAEELLSEFEKMLG